MQNAAGVPGPLSRRATAALRTPDRLTSGTQTDSRARGRGQRPGRSRRLLLARGGPGGQAPQGAGFPGERRRPPRRLPAGAATARGGSSLPAAMFPLRSEREDAEGAGGGRLRRAAAAAGRPAGWRAAGGSTGRRQRRRRRLRQEAGQGLPGPAPEPPPWGGAPGRLGRRGAGGRRRQGECVSGVVSTGMAPPSGGPAEPGPAVCLLPPCTPRPRSTPPTGPARPLSREGKLKGVERVRGPGGG